MALPKATDHYTYQMSPKFLVNVIPYAQLPDSMTSFAKKAKIQTLDWCNISKCCDMIGARYIPLCGNLIDVRYIPLCSNLIGVKYIPLYMLKERFFFIEKKITENCVVGHPTISLISSFSLCLQDLRRNALICELASLWFLGIIIR